MDVNFALEDYEVARGFILSCQSYPVTDKVTVDFDQTGIETSAAREVAWRNCTRCVLINCGNSREESPVSHPLFERHRATLDRAVQAIAERSYWSAYPESAESQDLRRRRGRGRQGGVRRAARQALSADAAGARSGRSAASSRRSACRSASRYPKADIDALLAAVATRARPVAQGRSGSVGRRLPGDSRAHQQRELRDRQRRHAHDRTGVHDGVPGRRPACAGPRARSGRLRVGRVAARAGEGATGKSRRARTSRSGWRSTIAIVPRGIGLVIGCCTFPTWNGYPGLFASLATGNAVIVKPHPGAILPLAITVRDRARSAGRGRLRSERRDAGRARRRRRHRANARAAARGEDHRLHRQHRQRPLARGERAAGAGVHRKGGRQPDHHRLRRRHARASRATSRSRWRCIPGQMCTAPQNIYVPKDGIDTAEGPAHVRPGRRGHRRGRAEAAGRSGARGRGAGRGAERRRGQAARGRALARARSCSTRRRSRIPRFRTRRSARR